MITFMAIPSTDGEMLCWDVDLDTFKNLMNRSPDMDEASVVNVNLYRIYPTDLLESFGLQDQKGMLQFSLDIRKPGEEEPSVNQLSG